MGSFYIPCVVMVLLYWRIFHTIRQRTRKSVAAAAASSVASSAAALSTTHAQQRHRKSTTTATTADDAAAGKPETTRDGRKSLPLEAIAETVAVTEMTGSDRPEPEVEAETGRLLVLDMASSTIETRRRLRRRPFDDASSDGDRETALIAHANSDDIAQLSSGSE